MEGRPDTEEQSVSLVTMHSSKGLEWPVVIPINMGGGIKDRIETAVDAQGRLHLPIFGLHGPGGQAAFAAESEEEARQRHRLWYVGATRARDLLLLPRFSTGIPAKSWMEHVGLRHDTLDPFDAARLGLSSLHRTEDEPNRQDRARFQAEAELIQSRQHRIRRVTPHLAETSDVIAVDPLPLPPDTEDADPPALPPRGSQARGLVLHKLLEEVLTGETDDNQAALAARAAELAAQLAGTPGVASLDPAEAARAVRRGLDRPEIAAVRDRLQAEYPVAHSVMDEAGEVVISGVADAVEPRPDRAGGGLEKRREPGGNHSREVPRPSGRLPPRNRRARRPDRIPDQRPR